MSNAEALVTNKLFRVLQEMIGECRVCGKTNCDHKKNNYGSRLPRKIRVEDLMRAMLSL